MASRSAWSPLADMYSATTCEPGAKEGLTQGFGRKPSARAFLATRPAATSTEGFEVLVQLVIAAMTTSPSRSARSLPAIGDERRSSRFDMSVKAESKFALTCVNEIRSCGRLGPASEDSTVPR